jgi:hypothetical protein
VAHEAHRLVENGPDVTAAEIIATDGSSEHNRAADLVEPLPAPPHISISARLFVDGEPEAVVIADDGIGDAGEVGCVISNYGHVVQVRQNACATVKDILQISPAANPVRLRRLRSTKCEGR